MKIFRRTPKPLIPPEMPATTARETLTSPPLVISEGSIAALAARTGAPQVMPFTGLPTPPPGVRPATDPPKRGMAMDEAPSDATGGAWGAWAQSQLWGEGLYFPGYPYLAELSQRPEYRNIVETVAEEMTRKWIKILSTGESDKTDKIKKLENAMREFDLRGAFRRAIEIDGFMGMGMIYPDLAGIGNKLVSDDLDELVTPLVISPAKIGRHSLRGFVVIDPTWVSPQFYNSINPLKDDFFKPESWYVMGRRTHASRLLIIRSREVPDLLKAAYNFGGISLAQMSKPYVDNWLRTRQSVSDLLHAFTVFVLKTNLTSLLANAQAMMGRLAAFVLGRDNKGLMLVDKETEELTNVSAPLGGLDKLQAQAQEQMSFPSQQPLLKFVGYTPAGLNSDTSDSVRTWYDRVKAKQETVFGTALTTALQIIQLSEMGSIDPDITYEFVDLWELDEAGKAAIQKTKIDADAVAIEIGVISPEESRTRLAGDPASPFHGLEGEAPEPPEESLNASLTDPAERTENSAFAGSTTGANATDMAIDKGFREADHRRGEDAWL